MNCRLDGLITVTTHPVMMMQTLADHHLGPGHVSVCIQYCIGVIFCRIRSFRDTRQCLSIECAHMLPFTNLYFSCMSFFADHVILFFFGVIHAHLSRGSLKRFDPRFWLPSLTPVWGIASITQGLVTNQAGLFGIRFCRFLFALAFLDNIRLPSVGPNRSRPISWGHLRVFCILSQVKAFPHNMVYSYHIVLHPRTDGNAAGE